MKRIEFIAPVESMRGNLGSKQSLYYNPNNNRAYDSIEGQINPALNYEPRLIGARGKRNYFCVKTKSSVHLTQRAKAAMSNLGGVGAIYSALVRNKMSNVYINAYGCYQDALAGGFIGTFRKYMYSFIQAALDAKEATINITTPNHSVSIDNPWVKRGACNIQINKTSINKFWQLLADNAGIVEIVGISGVLLYHKGDTFGDVAISGYNVLDLKSVVEDSQRYIKIGDKYVWEADESDPEDPNYGPVVPSSFIRKIPNCWFYLDVL